MESRSSTSVTVEPSGSTPRKRARVTDTDGPPAKRRHTIPDYVEAIDLSDDTAQQALEQRSKDLMKLQREEDDQPKRMGVLNCIICLDNFTNVTSTACGHIFCHECLTQALKAGERQNQTTGRGTGACPVCRKPLKRTKKGNLVPLVFMTKGKITEAA